MSLVGFGPNPTPTRAQRAALRMRWPTMANDIREKLKVTMRVVPTQKRMVQIDQHARSICDAAAIVSDGVLDKWTYRNHKTVFVINGPDQSIIQLPAGGYPAPHVQSANTRATWVFKAHHITRADGYAATLDMVYMLFEEKLESYQPASRYPPLYPPLLKTLIIWGPPRHGPAVLSDTSDTRTAQRALRQCGMTLDFLHPPRTPKPLDLAALLDIVGLQRYEPDVLIHQLKCSPYTVPFVSLSTEPSLRDVERLRRITRPQPDHG